jgi:transcriptional regulator with XRE-family HTH domain
VVKRSPTDFRIERATELAEFLRVHRERITPEDVGFPRGRRRRTRGLRREEVAHLAGVSVTWYTWLEQARPIRVSAETLESLARALRLTAIERTHLFLLGIGYAPVDGSTAPGGNHDGIARMLTSLSIPAYAVGPLWELLAWNASAGALLAFDELAPADRNLVWYIFAHPAARARIGDWEDNAQRVLAQFRAATARLVDDPRVAALVGRLQRESPEFALWWPRHEVAGRGGVRKEITHPTAGHMVFEHNALILSDAPDVRVVLYTPLDEDDTPTKLAALTR